MYWTQQRTTLALLIVQLLLAVIGIFDILFGRPQFAPNPLLIGASIALVTSYIVLITVYIRGWRPAAYIALILTMLVISTMMPEPFVSSQVSIVVLLPAVMAMIIGGPWLVCGIILSELAILVARSGTVYAQPLSLALIGMVIGGLMLGRLRFDTALHQLAAQLQRDLAQTQQLEQQMIAMRQSEERTAKLLAMNPAAIVVNSLIDGRYVFVNYHAARLLGRTPDDLLGQTPQALGIEVESAQNTAFAQAVIHRQSTQQIELHFRNQLGEIRHGLASLEFINMEGEPCTISMIIDITQRQRAARIRELERQFFECLAGNYPLPQVLERLTLAVEAYLSSSLCAIHLLDESCHRLVGGAAPSLPPAYVQALEGVLIGPTTGSCGTAMTRNQIVIVEDIATDPLWNGWRDLALAHDLRACWSFPFHDAQGQPVGTFAVYSRFVRKPTDADLEVLTSATHLASVAVERERIENELRRTERRFRALIDNAVDMVLILDRYRKIVYASPSVAVTFGGQSDALIGRDASDFVHPDDLPTLLEQLRPLLDQPGGAKRIPMLRILNENGTTHVIELVASNNLHDSAVSGIVLNCRDITERQLLEAQLLQAQKLESIGRLAGGVAHDFNNIITAVTGYADLALMLVENGEPAADELREIQRTAQRAAKLTRQLLAFARQQPIEPEILNLNTLLTDIDLLLHRLVSAQISLVVQPALLLPTIRGDAGQIEQVIVNLVLNAADAMPDGGTLLLSTEMITFDGTYAGRHMQLAPGRYVVLSVSDTGSGMDAQAKLHIFEPFFTTKEPGRGTGLGLAICHGIVKQHGGDIWFESEIGRGTTFRMFLPAVESAATINIVPVQTGLIGGREVILLVEDEALVRNLTVRMLQNLGYTVLQAHDGVDALELLAAQPKLAVDLLLTDVVMPRLGGRELALSVTQQRRVARVLFMSGYPGTSALLDGMPAAALGYMQKPFSVSVLTSTVRDLLDVSIEDTDIVLARAA